MKISPVTPPNFSRKISQIKPQRIPLRDSFDYVVIDLAQKLEKIHKLPPRIEFSEATTLEEAIEFGQNKLHIIDYKGFCEDDVDVVNWINEGLVNVNNFAKGKAVMPTEIEYVEKIDNVDTTTASAAINGWGDMKISKSTTQEIKSNLKEFLISILNEADPTGEITKDDIDKIPYKNARESYAFLLKQEGLEDNFSTFSDIYHEMGHQQHKYNTGIKTYTFLHDKLRANRTKKTAKMYEIFEKSKSIAKKVSPYAEESPVEFVAEVFSKLCNGEKLPNDVIKLYKKLGGKIYS